MVLIVEDDEAMRSLLCDELWGDGYQLREAANGHEGLESILTTVPDLIVTDLKMPAGGFDYIHRLRTFAPDCPIIVMTAFGEPHTKAEALRSGASAYVDKPVRLAELKLLVRQLLDRQPNGTGEQRGDLSGSPEARRPGVAP
ncbi:MAG: response regulator [Nitrospiraceae bacterium]|nr:response regulator [Nitrospiraceae bacterium]